MRRRPQLVDEGIEPIGDEELLDEPAAEEEEP